MYDIVGEDMLDVSGVGEDQETRETAGDVGFLGGLPFLGAPRLRPQAAPVAPSVQRAMAAPAASAAVPAQSFGPAILPRSGPTVIRRQVLPIPATSVPASGTVTVTLQPQRSFRVERLILGSTVSPSQIVVSDISVGAERQFVAAGDVPISAFSPDAVGTQLRGDTAQPGTTVTITLRNLSGSSAETVSGAFFGSSAD